MDSNQYIVTTRIAYHEAGHCFMGYLQGHSANFIDINFDPYPNVDLDFGNDDPIICEIHNACMQALSNRTLVEVKEVAKRYCNGLLAGTMSEYWHFQQQPTFDQINAVDKANVQHCINVLYQLFGTNFNRSDFLNERLIYTRDSICDPSNFAGIKKIALALMMSKDFRIERKTIEELM